MHPASEYSKEVNRLPFKNKEAMRQFGLRRMRRRSKMGRELELEIERILHKMQEDGLVADFRRFEPNSPEDREGCDFEVTVQVHGAENVKRFGVTISQKSWSRANVVHSDIPQFRFPPGTKEETVRKRILGLFK